MDDDKTGIIPDENLDDDASFDLGEDVLEEEIENVDDLEVIGESIAEVEGDEDFYFDEDDTLGSSRKKKVIGENEDDELSEDFDEEEDDDDDDFYTEDDDEARYNYKGDEDALDEGF